MPLVYYGSQISPHITKTPEGYLIAHDVPINRIGLYEYKGSEIGRDGNDAEKVFNVMRRPEEVFNSAALASFEGKPLTDGHPPDDVTPENIQYYGKGHVQNVRKGTGPNEGLTIADIFITDPQLIEDVENGKREISCGYDYELKQNPNGSYEQRAMRGNHVAVVESGRAGSRVAIRDSKPSFTERSKENMSDKPKSVFAKIFRAAAKDASITDEDLAAFTFARDEAPAVEKNPLPETNDPETAPAKDELPGGGVEAKLDKLLSLLEQCVGAMAKKPEAEDELEDLINPKHEEAESPEKEKEERETGSEDEDPEESEQSVTVDPEHLGEHRPATDSAMQAAKIMQGVLQKQFKDNPTGYKIAAKDAAAEIRKAYGVDKAPGSGYDMFVQATAQSQATRAAQDSLDAGEKAIAEAQAAYNSRNPHMKKEAK